MKSDKLMRMLFVFILCIIAPTFVHAQMEPPKTKIKGLFELDLFTQVVSRRVVEEPTPGDDFEGDAVSTRVLARIGIKPIKPLELYAQAGGANLHIDQFDDYRGDFSVAYGGGLKLTLFEQPTFERFRLVLSGDALTFTTDDRVQTTVGLVEEEIEWVEYTVSGIGTWRIANLEPYVGIRFSWLDSTDEIKDPINEDLDLEEDHNVGVVAGADIYLDPRENFALNVEGTLLDQASFKIGVKLWY